MTQQIAMSLMENKKASLADIREFSVQAKQLGDLFSNFKLQRQSMGMRGTGGNAYQRSGVSTNENSGHLSHRGRREGSAQSTYDNAASYDQQA